MKVLDEPKRISLRRELARVIPEEDAENLMSALPSGGDRIVTEDFFRAELAEFKTELGTEMEEKFVTKGFFRAELAEFKTELGTEMDEKFATKDFFRVELAGFKTELGTEMDEKFATKVGLALMGAELRQEMAGLRTEMAQRFEKQTSSMYRAILLSMPIGMALAGGVAKIVG